jgi:2-amino-4-hydroxy-6-hydroxymethyldihydropteridine diphosphokinase
MGDRFQNICDGMKELTSSESSEGNQRSNIILKDTSFLHETAPMYVTDQPSFINGVFEVETTLEPEALLKRLKTVEQRAGRHTSADGTKSIRYGPRPLDLDILLYQRFMSENSNTGDSHQEGSGKITFESTILDSEAEKLPLTIPHPRMHEREFVLSPICEIDPHVTHPILKKTMKELRHELQKQVPFEAYRVIPLPRQRFLQLNHTIVMGILNVTPDSFSDGGKLEGSTQLAVSTALQMEQDGAGIIDIGGESTRPGADEVQVEQELERTIPVIRALREGERC